MTDPKPFTDIDAEKLPDSLPIMPLFDAALFPKMVLPLMVMQGESIRLVDEAMSKDLVSKKLEEKSKQPQHDLYGIGTSALILKMAKTEDNKAQLLVQGLSRFRAVEFLESKPYLKARIEHIREIQPKDKESQALVSNILSQFTKVVELSPGLPPEIASMAKSIKEPGILADMIASTINSSLEEKQKILETDDVKGRLKEVPRPACSIINWKFLSWGTKSSPR